MPRDCVQCHRTLPKAAYSANQWRKRTTDGTDRPVSRCKECVASGGDAGASAGVSAGAAAANGGAAKTAPAAASASEAPSPQQTNQTTATATATGTHKKTRRSPKRSKKNNNNNQQQPTNAKADGGGDTDKAAAPDASSSAPTAKVDNTTGGGAAGAKADSASKAKMDDSIHDHSEVHTTPAGTMAVCADGDDSASRSGSKDEGDNAGGKNVDGEAGNGSDNANEKEEDEHVLFEPAEEGFVNVEMTTSQSVDACGANNTDTAEEGALENTPTGKTMVAWSDALESKKSSEVDLSAKAEAQANAVGTTSPNSKTNTATNAADLSAAETPKIRPARVVDDVVVGGGGKKSPGPPLPHFDLGETAAVDVRSEISANPTLLSTADSASAAALAHAVTGVPDAVHLPPKPQQIERRISEVTAPPGVVPPPATSAAASTSAPALSREVTEEHSNLSDSSAPVSVQPPPAAPAAKTTPPTSNNNAKKAAHRSNKSVNIFSARDAAHIAHRISTGDRIRVGICAMDKKARSKPMGEILSRLDETLFECVFFGDDLIKNSPVVDWPVVDVLIAFYSSGYPLSKAEEYVKLRWPFVLNDLEMQWTLKDRRKVYDLLESGGIDVPRHVYMSRDGYVSTGTGDGNGEGGDLIEHDDHIEVNGVVIHKPFVEKPVDADDHNIAIYYPTSAGGGCKKLFRKVGDRSSEFYPMINEVRRDGSFIYEEFVETQGTDVKMYTVGPDYGHAEARKSPTVDGKVERNSDGKEVRFPVILTLREKEIARRIVIVFKQQVCGFDLLRVQQGDSLVSYVCDVNGWSFVKNSRKYYDDCAQILTEHMLAAVRPTRLNCFSALDPLLTTMPDNQITPKKAKKPAPSAIQRVSRMLKGEPKPPEESSADIVPLSPARTESDTNSVQAPTTLEEGAMPISQIPHKLAVEPPSIVTSAASSVVDDGDEEVVSVKEPSTHKEELRCVIAVIRHGDRTPKQKLKVIMTEPRILAYFHEHCKTPKKDLKVKAKKPLEEFLKTICIMIADKEEEARSYGGKKKKNSDDGKLLYKLRHMRDVLQRWKIGGLNRKLQIKPQKWDETVGEDGKEIVKCTEVQLILKWGGNLTKLGEKQAINLGQRIRHELYPDASGGGVLRLHSTFRHDLKIKTSDEGRVMKTAAAGAKGLLELEGEIPPILVSLVHKEKDSIHMLDPSGNKEVKKELEICKKKINENLQKDVDFDETSVEEHEEIVGPVELTSLHAALREVKNPRKALFAIRSTMADLLEQLDEMLGLLTSCDESNPEGTDKEGVGESALSAVHIKLYKGETLLELTERWRLLYRKFYDEDTDTFDLSRVPDVHDNVRFDMLHNPHLGLTETLEKLYNMAKTMADCVVPQEYGTTIIEKRSIGQKMCRLLLDKIKYDLIIARTDDQVDMRYMINMEYSADLPINTMGRRVRTRLYFTSESHLHTLLNVLRFTYNDSRSSSFALSKRGRDVVDRTPELCYLTQIVFRLFEDPKKDMNDPKRFRLEILFSPGATATPLHMAEMDRDLDNSRFETDPLELISRDGLSCQEVEDYFSECIDEGKTDEDDDASIVCPPVSTEEKKKKDEAKRQRELMESEEASLGESPAAVEGISPPAIVETPADVEKQEASSVTEGVRTSEEAPAVGLRGISQDENGKIESAASNTPTSEDADVADDATDVTPVARSRDSFVSTEGDVDDVDGKEVPENESRKAPAKQSNDSSKLWASAAVVGGLLVVGALVLSRRSKR